MRFWSLPPLISGIILSGDNPADTGIRGISSEALKESSSVNGPSTLRTTDWPFKPDTRVIDKIRLKGPSCDIDICLENSSNFVVNVLTEKNFPFGKWERFNSIVKYKRAVAFLLRWLPSHKHFRSSILEITDPSEMDVIEQKLIYLSQGETFPSELKLLRSGKVITRNSRIAKYSPFIGPAGILRSTGRISRLVNSDFDSKHPIILDARHAVDRLLVQHLHVRNFHQGLDCMRSVKRVLFDILGNRRVTEEILRTTLCLVEQSLNARPITAVSFNPLDLEALTPNHFILGQHAASFPSLSFEKNFDHKKRFDRAQSYANAIWTRWMREFIPSLNRRAKWHNQSEFKMKAGDLVWVIEPDTPRGHYPLARILKLHYGKDGCARSADIKTITSELTRPTVKLAPAIPCLGVEDVAAQM